MIPNTKENKSLSSKSRYESRPHSKSEKIKQKKARRMRRKQLCLKSKVQSFVAELESERNKLLRDQLVKCKQKTDAHKAYSLNLEMLLDNCRNRKCINKIKVAQPKEHGKIFAQQSVNDKTIPNRVSLDEIDYITKGSETVVLGEGCFGKCFLARFKCNGVLVAVKIGQKYGKHYSDPLKMEVKMA